MLNISYELYRFPNLNNTAVLIPIFLRIVKIKTLVDRYVLLVAYSTFNRELTIRHILLISLIVP